ncbi:S8 family serine peptidase [uncultured Polaribacter sp.]|uniref:S8 family serine peptidase n=1 Tax=uncultured Polaribacter sp. TaxID=174711 RepID=UPI0026263BCC|nr:S8 family serine peptidase [uncultured Polaribacter sp.]
MKNIVFIFLIFFGFQLFAQQEDAWIFLKDKPKSESFLANPLSILSQRAIDRRNQQGVTLDVTDVPVDENYYNQLKNEPNITILGKSKWLNALHIQGTESVIKTLKTKFNFIESIDFADKSLNAASKTVSKKQVLNHVNKFKYTTTSFNYGATATQIKMLNGDFLHEQGLTGKNQVIAIMDAGFPNVNTLPAFKRIRANNQILGGYNFADRNTSFYTRNNHGTNVLSTIGGYLEDQFVGTAPDAKFYLFITEVVESETVLEETLWVEAAERADSLGVDVINTSLGYSTFDNSKHNYTYADMDGKTTFISRGAEIASQKGILVVNSAGNSGISAWKHITAPADAASVISVGAVDSSKNISPFSSFGPSFDGRIKPEILALGTSASVINHTNGAISNANGTSFSAPIMAGLIACLNDNEGFILKSSAKKNSKNFNDYLKEAVYKSADRYANPTDQHGYGIPDFKVAFTNFTSVFSVDSNSLNEISIYPNPVVTIFKVNGIEEDLERYQYKMFDVLGKKVLQQVKFNQNQIDISLLKKGVYFLQLSKDNQQKTIKILKQ